MTLPINPLEGMLGKYLKQLEEVDKNRTKICEIIKEVTGVTIKVKEVEIADHILMIRAHPAKRQIIMFKKNDLLYEIQQVEELSKILDIK